MTWYSTWPSNGKPAYREHPTEAQAEAHAKFIVDSKTALYATAFEANQPEMSA
ncbi:hypothetical protein [Arthrobacter sp. Alg241-R88]|uniref:hypothetical protein n=1 Tax=Arthrobacter sp. Alg241-R88 TaxID=2305984 RepID=UPI0013D0C3DB|nr:hypothetical protein [Arthrobacter sp. Alg241-R88]